MTISSAAQTGDRLETLKALRDKLAEEIDGCESGRDIAALSLRLTDVLAQIEDLAPSEEVDAVDEIAARRNLRRAGAAKSQARAKRSS